MKIVIRLAALLLAGCVAASAVNHTSIGNTASLQVPADPGANLQVSSPTLSVSYAPNLATSTFLATDDNGARLLDREIEKLR